MLAPVLAILLAAFRDEVMCSCAETDPLHAVRVDSLTPDEREVEEPSIVVTKVDAPGRRAYARIVNPLERTILVECTWGPDLRVAVETPSLVVREGGHRLVPWNLWHEVPPRSSTLAVATLPVRAVESPLVLRWKLGLGEPPSEMRTSVIVSPGALRHLARGDDRIVAPSLEYLGPADASPWCHRYRFELVNPYDRVVHSLGPMSFDGPGVPNLICIFPWDPDTNALPARTAVVLEGNCRTDAMDTARCAAHLQLTPPDLVAHSFPFDVNGEQFPVDPDDAELDSTRPFALRFASFVDDWGDEGVRFELVNGSSSSIRFVDPSWDLWDPVFLRLREGEPPVPN